MNHAKRLLLLAIALAAFDATLQGCIVSPPQKPLHREEPWKHVESPEERNGDFDDEQQARYNLWKHGGTNGCYFNGYNMTCCSVEATLFRCHEESVDKAGAAKK